MLMKSIKFGDKKVLGEGGKFECVCSFGWSSCSKLGGQSFEDHHQHPKEHMVFIQEGGRCVPASHIKVDDKLDLTNNEFATVRGIRLVKRKGAYSPFSESGITSVVNGVKSSTFICAGRHATSTNPAYTWHVAHLVALQKYSQEYCSHGQTQLFP